MVTFETVMEIKILHKQGMSVSVQPEPSGQNLTN